MKRILVSLATISAVGLVAVLASQAFFSDEETSHDNTFVAGSIDLKVDSQCSYNGVSSNECGTWDSRDLVDEKFFNFTDLKPGDYGENTISILVDDNDSWVCAKIDVTSDDDITCTESENTDEGGLCSTDLKQFNGEIRENLSLAWWADNGDNVLDANEVDTLFFLSGAKLSDLLTSAGGNTLYLTLADSFQNFFGDDGTPIDGDTPYYIGLSWCFGDMSVDETAITCDGELVNNESQTDALTADLSFYAVQSRNNLDFRCEDTYKPVY